MYDITWDGYGERHWMALGISDRWKCQRTDQIKSELIETTFNESLSIRIVQNNQRELFNWADPWKDSFSLSPALSSQGCIEQYRMLARDKSSHHENALCNKSVTLTFRSECRHKDQETRLYHDPRLHRFYWNRHLSLSDWREKWHSLFSEAVAHVLFVFFGNREWADHCQ